MTDKQAEVETLSTDDLWELRAHADEDVRRLVEAEVIARLNGKADPTAEPEPEPEPDVWPEELGTLSTPDGRELVAHPVTGEALDLDVMTVGELHSQLTRLGHHMDQVVALRKLVVKTIAGRVDRTGARTAVIDGLRIKVNAPTQAQWDMDVVERNLRLLVEADVLDAEVLTNIIVTPERPPRPAAPPPYVDSAKAKALAVHPDARVREALRLARSGGKADPPVERKLLKVEQIPETTVVD